MLAIVVYSILEYDFFAITEVVYFSFDTILCYLTYLTSIKSLRIIGFFMVLIKLILSEI